MSCDRREYQKEYLKEYRNRPENKKKMKEYNARPGMKKYKKEYEQRPEVKKRRKEYDQRSDVKAKKKEYRQRPERKNQTRNKGTEMKIQVVKKLGGACVCCGNSEWWNLAVDHIKPITGQKRYTNKLYKSILDGNTDNFQLLCFGCNISKGNRDKCRLNHTW